MPQPEPIHRLVVLGDNGYPSEAELQAIRDWEPDPGWRALMEFVKARWQYADVGYWRQVGDRYEISTGGWSGNEDLISALQETYGGVFWSIVMVAHHVGGHYTLDVQALDPDGRSYVRDRATPLDAYGFVRCGSCERSDITPPPGKRLVLMDDELFAQLGAGRVEWGEPDEHGWYTPMVSGEHHG